MRHVCSNKLVGVLLAASVTLNVLNLHHGMGNKASHERGVEESRTRGMVRGLEICDKPQSPLSLTDLAGGTITRRNTRRTHTPRSSK